MSPAAKHASHKDWMAVLGMVLGAFIAVLDIQIVNSSLKEIQGSLAATLDEGSWISTAYMIAEIIMIPLATWVASVFSLRTYMLGTVTLFLLASTLCGMAWNLESMIVFRVFQGIAAAPMIPLAFNQIKTRLPAADQVKGMALFSFTATFAPAIGPSLGGWLTEQFSWNLIFFINIVPGVAMLVMLARSLDPEPMQLHRLKEADWAGIISLAIGLGMLEYFLEEGNRKEWFESEIIVWSSIIACISLTLFVYFQLTRKNPLLNLRILGQRQFFLGNLANMGAGVAMYGSVYILPLYLGQVQGYNALQIGEVLIWGGIPQLFLIPLVPKIMQRFDARYVAAFGFAMFTLSCWLNTHLTMDYSGEQFHLALLIRALGQPFLMVPLSLLVVAKVDPKDIPSASSLFNTSRNLAGAIGIALLATVIRRSGDEHASRIGESVTTFGDQTRLYLDQLGSLLPQLNYQQQVAMINQQVVREGSIMAYSDAFWVVTILLGVGLILTLMTGRTEQ